jgi:hypothetical protein
MCRGWGGILPRHLNTMSGASCVVYAQGRRFKSELRRHYKRTSPHYVFTPMIVLYAQGIGVSLVCGS